MLKFIKIISWVSVIVNNGRFFVRGAGKSGAEELRGAHFRVHAFQVNFAKTLKNKMSNLKIKIKI